VRDPSQARNGLCVENFSSKMMTGRLDEVIVEEVLKEPLHHASEREDQLLAAIGSSMAEADPQNPS
jgi:hypothetical protein